MNSKDRAFRLVHSGIVNRAGSTMQTMSQKSFRALAALSLSLVFGLAHGQDNESYDPDPPDRAARLSYIQGDVSMQPAGEDDWADAIVNRPLTTGDKLWLDQDGRAEIYVGEAAVRLGSNTGFSFLNVDDDTIQMRMTAGVIDVNVHALDGNDQIEVDTPNIALSILRPGRYRVEVNDAGDATVVKISEGMAEASSGSHSTVVHAQQAATFRGEGEIVAQLGSLGAPDEFDTWSLERDRRDRRAASSQTAQYVAPEVTGYQDLDDNGSWSSEPEYGYVWTPRRVAIGWSPYQYGRWVWVSPWGWTWIDDAPWGYAPFHYGRWAHVRERWCWVPGPRHVRAVYAPALVGWVGSPGLSVSVSIGGGGVGWFPLGPREVYVPARRFSNRYVERVNVSNTVIVNRTYITNVYNNRERNVTYRNRGVPGAVTAVSRTTFTSAQRVGDHRVRFDEREVSRTQGTAMAPQIAPVRESRLGADSRARVNGRAPPRTVVDRQVVVKRDPPPAASHFVRRDGAGNPARERMDGSQRAPDVRQDNRVEARPSRTDRPQRGRPDTRIDNGQSNPAANAQPRVDREPRQEQPRPDQSRAAVAPPVQTAPVQTSAPERQREDRPQRWQREREAQADPQQQQQRQQNEQFQRQQHEQRQRQSEQQRQDQDNARAAREQQRSPAPQPAERREPPAERPQVERPERQERQERQERPKAEPRQQSERRPQREERRNQDDERR
jgi:hypothetical protein